MLVIVQALAFGKQLALGFRPFVTTPVRVPLSWDMFAVDIARCSVQWHPPLHIDGRSIGSLHDFSAPFEWDIVYNTPDQYRGVAKYACLTAAPGPDSAKRYRLTCWVHPPQPSVEEASCAQ